MEKHIKSFRAQRDNGEVVTIEEYQDFIDVTSHQDSTRQWAPGLKRLELRNGGAVNFIDEKTFEIVATGERLTIP